MLVGFAGKLKLSGGDSVNPGKQTGKEEEGAVDCVWGERK